MKFEAFYGSMKVSAFAFSALAIFGFACLAISVDSRAQSILLNQSMPIVKRPALEWQISLRTKSAFILPEGEILKLQEPSEDAQCFVKNEGKSAVRLSAALKLEAKSIAGNLTQARFHDWEFNVSSTVGSQTNIQIHCEFPRGVAYTDLYREAGKALSSHFELFPPGA